MSGHMAAVLFRFVSLLSVQCLRLSCSTDGAEQKESASVCKYLPQFQDRLVLLIWNFGLYIYYMYAYTHTHVRLSLYTEVFYLKGENRW